MPFKPIHEKALETSWYRQLPFGSPCAAAAADRGRFRASIIARSPVFRPETILGYQLLERCSTGPKMESKQKQTTYLEFRSS
jgi:hypothetical protein